MLMKLCAICHRPTKVGQVYCDACQPIAGYQEAKSRAKRAKKYNALGRDPQYARFYKSKAWRALRNKKMSDVNYLCEVCRKIGKRSVAEDVHHIVPVKQAWDKRFDYDNLMAVCVSCHNKLDKRF